MIGSRKGPLQDRHLDKDKCTEQSLREFDEQYLIKMSEHFWPSVQTFRTNIESTCTNYSVNSKEPTVHLARSGMALTIDRVGN